MRAWIPIGLLAAAFSEDLGHIPEVQWLSGHVPGANIVVRALDLETLITAARRGVGALVVAEALAASSGGLIRAPVKLWLVAHRALRSVPPIAVTWDWLLETFDGTAEDAVATTLPPQGST